MRAAVLPAALRVYRMRSSRKSRGGHGRSEASKKAAGQGHALARSRGLHANRVGQVAGVDDAVD